MSAQTITFQSDVSSVCINENLVLVGLQDGFYLNGASIGLDINTHPLHKLLKFMDYNFIIHRISLPLAVVQSVHCFR